MFGKSAVAKWDRELGRLVFEGVSLPANCVQLSDSCWLPDRWSVRFWLQNRAQTAAGQALPFIEASSGIAGADDTAVTGHESHQQSALYPVRLGGW